MVLEHLGRRPRIHATAYVAPTATICGDVSIGEGSPVLFGAVLVAEGGPVEIGRSSIVMEHAVIRGTARHPVRIGDHVLVGPHAHLPGCVVEDGVFIATGAAIFNGARLGARSEVRIHGVVHLKTHVAAGETVPIGWLAVGAPASILPPNEHEKIWAIQRPLNFPLTVYGLDRSEADMVKITRHLSETLGSHAGDEIAP